MHFVNIMKIEEQRLEIAKFCGWIEIYRPELYEFNYRNTITDELSNELPDYLNDLNAIHAAEEKLTDVQQEQYPIILHEVVGNFAFWWAIAHADASQRCEALLRTIGKWKD